MDKFFTDSRRWTAGLAVVFGISVVLAVINRFIQDDAYISFRYAFNLTAGDGLVWNIGERIEGYTNFLWTLLMSIPMWMGRDAVIFSQVLGIASFAGTLVFTVLLALLVFRSRTTALLAVLFLGTNYTFSAYATGGLETQLQAFLLVAAAYLTLKTMSESKRPAGWLVVVSCLYAGALLTRLDSAVALLPLVVFLLWWLVKSTAVEGRRMSRAGAYLIPGAIIVAAWLLWKYFYYGDLLPNSFYAKATASVTSIERGWMYYYHFFVSYLLFPFVLIFPFRAKKILDTPFSRVLLAVLLVWSAYVVKVGGDFMEFRFLVPVMPFGMILLARLIASIPNRTAVVVLGLLVVAGSVKHSMMFEPADGIASIERLHGHIIDDNKNWDEVGRALRRYFPAGSGEVTIATTAAGAIPYYSRLRTIDMLGINDKWVARNGVVASSRPGHQRFATHEYLNGRGVNLVIGHPRVHRAGTPLAPVRSIKDLEDRFLVYHMRAGLIPGGAKIVEFPVGEGYKIEVLYLVQNEAVDRAIARNGLRVYPLQRQ